MAHGDGAGRAVDLRGDPIVQAAAVERLDRAGGAIGDERAALGGGEHRDPADRDLEIGDQRLEQRREARRQLGDRVAIDAIGAVAEHAGDPGGVLGRIEREVEVGRVAGARDRPERQRAGRDRLGGLGGEVVVQHLEQRLLVGVARGAGRFEHLLERQRGVGERAGHGVLDAREVGREPGVRRDLGPQHARVDEEPDERRELGAAIGDRRADPHLRLAGVAIQQHLQPAEQHAVQRGALAPRHVAQPIGERRADREPVLGLAGRGPGAWRRQLEPRALAREPVAPVREIGLVRGSRGLPRRVVRDLDRQRRERERLTRRERRVAVRELAPHHVDRPAVAHDVVDHEVEHVVLVRAPDQHHPQQRIAREIERPRGLAGEQRRELVVAGAGRQRGGGELDRSGRGDRAERPALVVREPGAQHLVARDHRGERAGERTAVERPGQPQRSGEVRGGATWIELVQEPQPLLAGRQRQPLVARDRGDRGGRGGGAGGAGRVERGRERAERRGADQVARIERDAELGGGPRGELHRDQRAAARDQAVRGADVGDPEHVARDRRDPRERLGGGRRRAAGRARPALEHRVGGQRAVAPALQARGAPQLAARRHRQRARIEQQDHGRRIAVRVGDRVADRAVHRVGRDPLLRVLAELDRDADGLAGLAGLVGDREHRDAAAAHHVDLGRDRLLEILRVQVLAADDHHVLAPAGDVELAVVGEPEIAGAQRVAGAPCRGAGKRVGRRGDVVPVAERDARALHDDLADVAGRDPRAGLGIDDAHREVARDRSARHHRATVAGRGHGPAGGERRAIELAHGDAGVPRAAGDQEGRLGEPVARVQRARAEPDRRELLGERRERGGADRLGAAERDLPRRERVAVELVRLHPIDAHAEREVGAAADRAAVARDRAQPARRARPEVIGRHQHQARAVEQRRQRAADQPHVVIQRQPADHHVVGVVRERVADAALVGDDVAVAHHHAARRAGRARGVLQERDLVGARGRRDPVGRGARGELVAGDRVDPRIERELRHRRGDRRQAPRRGQHQARPGVARDAAQPLEVLAAARLGRKRRHRDHAGDQAAEEPDDVVIVVGVEHQRARTARHPAGDRGGHRLGAGPQRAVAELGGHGLAVAEHAQRDAIGVVLGALAEERAQRGGRRGLANHRIVLGESGASRAGRSP